jgi:hypothetical protein
MIANGYLRLDREEWFRVVEKRRDAQAVPPGGATVCRVGPRGAIPPAHRPRRRDGADPGHASRGSIRSTIAIDASSESPWHRS